MSIYLHLERSLVHKWPADISLTMLLQFGIHLTKFGHPNKSWAANTCKLLKNVTKNKCTPSYLKYIS